jgi:aspartate racemase
MKVIGVIGGIGPESTIEYYRYLIAGHLAQTSDGSYPAIVITSVDLTRMIAMMTRNEFPAAAEYLLVELQRLAAAGAQIGLIAANTAHIVFDEVEARSPIPLVSIVEATRAHAESLGLRRVGLFGTRFTMQARFYQDTFARHGMEVVVPAADEQAYIHDKYLNELLKTVFLSETRQRLLAIADDMIARDRIEGLILGGTELPLILREPEHNGIPLLDTTKIHVRAVLDRTR